MKVILIAQKNWDGHDPDNIIKTMQARGISLNRLLVESGNSSTLAGILCKTLTPGQTYYPLAAQGPIHYEILEHVARGKTIGVLVNDSTTLRYVSSELVGTESRTLVLDRLRKFFFGVNDSHFNENIFIEVTLSKKKKANDFNIFQSGSLPKIHQEETISLN